MEGIQLHIFSDAFEAVFGYVAYKGGGYSCSLVMLKCCLAPIKVVMLPLLELNAAARAVTAYNPRNWIQFWSDSTIALQYINNQEKRLKVFEANRSTEINELSEPVGSWTWWRECS